MKQQFSAEPPPLRTNPDGAILIGQNGWNKKGHAQVQVKSDSKSTPPNH